VCLWFCRFRQDVVYGLVVGVNAELSDQPVVDYDAPSGGGLPSILRRQLAVNANCASGRPKCSNPVATGKDVFVRNTVIRAHDEIAPPASTHLFASAYGH